jgi:DNA-binding transcriptional regulator YdaS (Cro superfamily)
MLRLAMSKLLDQALDAVRAQPPEIQDDIARAMLALVGNEEEPEDIDPEHLPAVLEGLNQMKRGQVATPAQIEAAFKRFGP